LIIIINTVLILISDPTDPDNLGNLSDDYFLYFYTVEAVLKIITFTFISAEDAYLKDYWNILDFSVVLVGWISFIIERVMNGTKITGLAGLRAFRILRPLKTVKRFKGLKKLVTALLASISHLGETTIVLIFVFLIIAIGGRQMWMGNFYRRCMNVNYGYLYSTQSATMMCSFDTDCQELNSYGDTYVCAKGYSAYQSYLDATFIVATIYICLGGLLWTTNMGVFDGLNYGFSKAFTSKNHSKDLYSYMQTKNTKRQKTKYAWTTFIVIGVLLFLITLILYIIYVNKILPSLAD
jgi:hypothetical protein